MSGAVKNTDGDLLSTGLYLKNIFVKIKRGAICNFSLNGWERCLILKNKLRGVGR